MPVSERASRPPAVLLVGNFLSTARGNQGVCFELAAQLRSSGWSVICTSPRHGRVARLADMLATTWRYRHRYDIAHVDVFSGLAFVWSESVCWMLRRLGKPFVLTLHGGNLPDFARRSPTRVRRLLSSAKAVTTPSRYLFEHLAPYRSDLVLLPNPLDLTRYRFRARSNPSPRLVWLRAFHTIYNPALAARVVADLVREFPSIELMMVGPTKDVSSLDETRRVARDCGIADRVTMPGGVPRADVASWLDKGDIFLNTTNVDNTPISVLEAMACGLCIVSTNVGGIPYLVRHEQEALLAPPNDARAMAAAVGRILTEPGLAGYLSTHARRRAESFDWSQVLPQWLTLLSRIAERTAA